MGKIVKGGVGDTSMSGESNIREFPRQKVSYRVKNTQKWQEESVDGVINSCNKYSNSRRSDAKVKARNYDLFNNKIDRKNFEYVLNPFNLEKEILNNFEYPANLQPYDVLSPIFMLLFGEETKRYFDPVVMAVNRDSVNAKSELKKEKIIQNMIEFMTQMFDPNGESEEPITPDNVLEAAQMNTKDMREKTAQEILTYYYKHGKLDEKFATGWKDVLIASEEIYRIDDVPTVKTTRCNPLEMSFVLAPNEIYLDECEKIYERNRMSVSQLIDEYYEFLTPKQIDHLEELKSGYSNPYAAYPDGPPTDVFFSDVPIVNSIYDITDGHQEYGIYVHRVRWKSKKKLGVLHTIDPETQEESEDIVDEFYKEDKTDKNSWVEWMWINEYWEGTRIGEDIYINVRPRKQQFRSMDNLSSCKSGYVGTVYNALNSKAVSLMDRLFPWLSLYLVIMYRTELLLAANYGKISLIDTSLIPDGWEVEKWLYYAQSTKIGFVNSYNVGAKGERTGTQNQSTQNRVLDMETGNSIQFHVELLRYLEEKMHDTAGITPQRMGAVSPNELVGNSERAVVQSSHITEEWFRLHNLTKVRVCETMIEAVKETIGDGKESFQYVTDDLATFLFEVDGAKFSEADYGVFADNTGEAKEIRDMLKQHMQAAIQNDQADISLIADVISTKSIATLRAKLKKSAIERQQAQQEQQEQQLASAEEIANQATELKLLELELERYTTDANNETKLQVAQINAYIGQEDLDQNNNDIPDPIELATLGIKERELKSKEMIERLKIQQTKVQNRSQEKIANKQAELKEKEIKAKERIEKAKAKKASTAKK